MISEILSIFSSFTGAMKKEAVYDYTEFLFTSINDEVLPAFQVILADKSIDVISKNTTLKNFIQDLLGH